MPEGLNKPEQKKTITEHEDFMELVNDMKNQIAGFDFLSKGKASVETIRQNVSTLMTFAEQLDDRKLELSTDIKKDTYYQELISFYNALIVRLRNIKQTEDLEKIILDSKNPPQIKENE